MASETFNEFFDTYLTGTEPIFEVHGTAERWPNVIVRHADYSAVVQFMGLGDHLCIDVFPFVAGRKARASAFGMEQGRRVEAFDETQVEGSSHQFPAASTVSVLVGKQVDTPSTGVVRWEVDNAGVHSTAGGWRLYLSATDQWILDGPEPHNLGKQSWTEEAQDAAAVHIKAYRARQARDNGTPERIDWRRVDDSHWLADDIHPLVRRDAQVESMSIQVGDKGKRRPAGWYLTGAGQGTGLFMSAERDAAMRRANAVIAAWNEARTDVTIDDLTAKTEEADR